MIPSHCRRECNPQTHPCMQEHAFAFGSEKFVSESIPAPGTSEFEDFRDSDAESKANTGGSKGLSAGALGGIIAGSLAAATLVCAAGAYIAVQLKKGRNKNQSGQEQRDVDQANSDTVCGKGSMLPVRFSSIFGIVCPVGTCLLSSVVGL